MNHLHVSSELVDALQELSSLLEADDILQRTLKTVVDLSVATLPGCDAAGVTVRVGGKDHTAAASDEYTKAIDDLQYEFNEGPCAYALESNEVVRIDDIARETRWPNFTREAAKRSLRSSLSLPLRGDSTSGALNLYAKGEDAFEAGASDIAEIFARQASIALQNASTYLAARRLSEQLGEALESRDIIGQAKGILMEREGVTDDQAFEMLKSASQNANLKLREIAQRIVGDKSIAG